LLAWWDLHIGHVVVRLLAIVVGKRSSTARPGIWVVAIDHRGRNRECSSIDLP
jgi:hypothetical protein